MALRARTALLLLKPMSRRVAIICSVLGMMELCVLRFLSYWNLWKVSSRHARRWKGWRYIRCFWKRAGVPQPQNQNGRLCQNTLQHWGVWHPVWGGCMKLDYRIIVLSSIFDLSGRLHGHYINCYTAAGINTEIWQKNIPRVQKWWFYWEHTLRQLLH